MRLSNFQKFKELIHFATLISLCIVFKSIYGKEADSIEKNATDPLLCKKI